MLKMPWVFFGVRYPCSWTFILPERLNAEYVTENNDRARPVMLHRAILSGWSASLVF